MLGIYALPREDTTRPVVSVLIPTRGRPEKLKRAVQSLHSNANKNVSYEVIIKVDTDDQATLNLLYNEKLPVNALISERGRGYLDLHKFIHQMANRARGYWLFCFNDDAVMQTKNWTDSFDVIAVEDYDGQENFGSRVGQKQTFYVDDIWLLQFTIANRDRPSHEFFAVTKKAYEVLGRLSENTGVDLWLHSVFNSIARATNVDRIVIEHENEPDQTFTEGRSTIKGGLHQELRLSPQVLKGRLQDAMKLMDYIAQVQENKQNPMVCERVPEGLSVQYAGHTGLIKNTEETACLL